MNVYNLDYFIECLRFCQGGEWSYTDMGNWLFNNAGKLLDLIDDFKDIHEAYDELEEDYNECMQDNGWDNN